MSAEILLFGTAISLAGSAPSIATMSNIATTMATERPVTIFRLLGAHCSDLALALLGLSFITSLLNKIRRPRDPHI